MMGTEIFKIDASWAEKLTKTRVPFLSAPTVKDVTFSSVVPTSPVQIASNIAYMSAQDSGEAAVLCVRVWPRQARPEVQREDCGRKCG